MARKSFRNPKRKTQKPMLLFTNVAEKNQNEKLSPVKAERAQIWGPFHWHELRLNIRRHLHFKYNSDRLRSSPSGSGWGLHK